MQTAQHPALSSCNVATPHVLAAMCNVVTLLLIKWPDEAAKALAHMAQVLPAQRPAPVHGPCLRCLPVLPCQVHDSVREEGAAVGVVGPGPAGIGEGMRARARGARGREGEAQA
jgi:hypothetical protein